MKTYLILLVIFILFSCNKLSENIDNEKIVHKETLTGYAQKGPYLNGSSITIFELDENLNQTGKTFVTQISDNTGLFSLNDLDLISQYVLLKVDGYYFNEVKGENENSPLTLYALSDITDLSTINVNIMTYLEKNRIEYLINNGIDFSVAKDSAQKELLRVFSISKDTISNSETLDISQAGDVNAILLAISVILQSNREIAYFTELLANFINDFKEDGQIDTVMVKKLYQKANLLSFSTIRENLENRYIEIGVTSEIANFENYINNFIQFQKQKYEPPISVSDIDGNIYHGVYIGDQIWLNENLKVTHFCNGDPIPNVIGAEWSSLTTGAYCDYDNNENNSTTYGRLYNWFATNDSRNLAPEGWHIPSDEEWQNLIEFIGGNSIASGKMKEQGTEHWNSPNAGATNESGFSALPSGSRSSYGDFYGLFDVARFWFSSEYDSINAWWADLVNWNSEFSIVYDNKKYGNSVRCVRD